MNPWTEKDVLLYSKQFDNAKGFLGKVVSKVVFYLEDTDCNFSEQPNKFGKSLFNGIDIHLENEIFSIGNRFNDSLTGYGLSIDKGKTSDFENIEESKKEIIYESSISGQKIDKVSIFWAEVPWTGSIGFYPQEIIIETKKGYFLLSSIEVNEGEVNTEFTDELLVIETKSKAESLKLGEFGIESKGRLYFENFEELQQEEKKKWP